MYVSVINVVDYPPPPHTHTHTKKNQIYNDTLEMQTKSVPIV